MLLLHVIHLCFLQLPVELSSTLQGLVTAFLLCLLGSSPPVCFLSETHSSITAGAYLMYPDRVYIFDFHAIKSFWGWESEFIFGSLHSTYQSTSHMTAIQ